MLRKRKKSEGEYREESERKQAELFWLKEQEAQQHTWDQQAELDYQDLAHKQQGRVEDSSYPELFDYKKTSNYNVTYMGVMMGLNFQPITETGKSDFVEQIDLAQRQGRIPWVANVEDARTLTISRHEVKITDTHKLQVYHRHTLHKIVGIIYFEDAFGKYMLSLQMRTDNPICFDFFIYGVNNESDGKNICLTLAQAFETIQKKLRC
ncbi:hypothetical protein LOD99_11851 [Oopsacas minuta]|uniref:Uncharacterized protein n=1 Tax=Oopsacas minuta TaxID=111878 RepID=A0AAV7JKR0_9METZ|nr:hypothetical protein LOD99_11851 [Oopsacas minuta]